MIRQPKFFKHFGSKGGLGKAKRRVCRWVLRDKRWWDGSKSHIFYLGKQIWVEYILPKRVKRTICFSQTQLTSNFLQLKIYSKCKWGVKVFIPQEDFKLLGKKKEHHFNENKPIIVSSHFQGINKMPGANSSTNWRPQKIISLPICFISSTEK